MKIIKLPTDIIEDGGTWSAELVLRKVVLTLPYWRSSLDAVNHSLEIHEALDKSVESLELSTDGANALAVAMRLEGVQPQFSATFSRYYQRVFRSVLIADKVP